MEGSWQGGLVVAPFEIDAIRIAEERLLPCQVRVKLQFDPNAANHPDRAQAGEQSALGFQLVSVWFQHFLKNPIIADINSELAQELLYSADNLFMMTPGIPSNFTLARLFYNKIQAVSRGLITVGSVSVATSETDWVERVWNYPDTALPDVSYAGRECLHKVPWWNRGSAETQEFFKEDLDDDDIKIYNSVTDPLEDLYQELTKTESDSEAEIIDNIWK